MAGTTLGHLAVGLSVDSSKFTKGIDRAGKSVGRFSSKISAGIGKMAALGGALVGVAGISGLGLLLKSTMANIDATAKLADTLGFTTEQLTAYQHVAAISGVTNEQLATGFKRMEKNISDAGVGLTTAVRAFDALGLSHKQLSDQSPDEQFKSIADALNKIPKQSDKARVALDLFGRSGLGLLKVTELGADGIEKLQQEARDLGLTFSRSMAAKVEAANDAITRLKGAMLGIVNTITIAIAPAIERISNLITSVSGKTTLQFVAVAASFTATAAILPRIIKLFNGIAIALKGVAKGEALALSFGGPIGWARLAAGVAAAAVAFHTIDAAFADTEASGRGAASAVGEVGGAVDGLNSSLTSLVDTLGHPFFAEGFVDPNITLPIPGAGRRKPPRAPGTPATTPGDVARQTVFDVIDGLSDEVSKFDLTESEQKLFEFNRILEKSNLSEVQRENALTSYTRRLEELDRMTAERAAAEAEVAESIQPPEDEDIKSIDRGPAGALTRGSAAEFAARIAATSGSPEGKIAKDTEKNTDKTAQNTTQLLDIVREFGLTQQQALVVSI